MDNICLYIYIYIYIYICIYTCLGWDERQASEGHLAEAIATPPAAGTLSKSRAQPAGRRNLGHRQWFITRMQGDAPPSYKIFGPWFSPSYRL